MLFNFLNIKGYIVTNRNISILAFVLVLLLGCNKNTTTANDKINAYILSFEIKSHSLKGKIDNDNKAIYLKIPLNINITNLIPTIELSEGSTISPPSGVAQDFSKTLTYTVHNEDNKSVIYNFFPSIDNYIINSSYHIVHMQNHFIKNLSIHNSNQVISSIKHILELARSANIPIVFSKSQPGGNRDIINELTPKINETVIESSNDIPIIEKMQSLGVERVVVVGIYTDACVNDICIDLHEADFEVILVRDATSVASNKNLDVIAKTCQELEKNGIVTLIYSNDVIF